jgi:rare lipoprotein A
MYRTTAAHKTLPLGCHVRVTNTVNGRQIIVRVNDRGPFVSGRIVDLSYQAAKELDMLAAGVTPVSLEVVTTGARASGPVSRAAEGSGYTLQVAAYGDRQTADQVAVRLAARHPPASIQVARTGTGTMYRVRTGKFPSRAAAEAARVTLWENGYPGAFIVAE